MHTDPFGHRARLLTASLVLLSACGDEVTDPGIWQGCDIRTDDCQESVFAATADLRDQSDAELPGVRTLNLDEFEAVLIAASQEQDQEADQRWTAALQSLGLLPADTTVAKTSIDEQLDTVVAVYDDKTREVSVIDRGYMPEPLNAAFTLSHEFVHALQDDEIGLTAFREAHTQSTDNEVAIRTLIEGEATVLAAATLEHFVTPQSDFHWDNFTTSATASIFHSIETSERTLISALLSLPYGIGVRELSPVWRTDGADGIKDLYASPALTLLDWVEGDAIDSDGKRRVAELECYPTVGPSGYEAIDHDTLGMAGLYAADLIASGPTEGAWDRARAWRGDSLVVFQAKDDASLYATAWRIALRKQSDAEDLTTRLEDLDAMVSVVRDAREVLVVGATDAAVLQHWSEATSCGDQEDLPTRPQPRHTDQAARTHLMTSRGGFQLQSAPR